MLSFALHRDLQSSPGDPLQVCMGEASDEGTARLSERGRRTFWSQIWDSAFSRARSLLTGALARSQEASHLPACLPACREGASPEP